MVGSLAFGVLLFCVTVEEDEWSCMNSPAIVEEHVLQLP